MTDAPLRGRKPLPKRERGIAGRLKASREMLRFSQAEFASQLGINRQRLASYEECRAPVRFDLALRICRQFVLSEKWLATGKGLMRQCLDLNSRGETHQVPIDTPFGAAYDSHLGRIYEGVKAEQGDNTVILLRDTDDLTFLRNYFTYCLGLWIDEIPKVEKVPHNYVSELCSLLVGIGLDFVEFTIANQRTPHPKELILGWVKTLQPPPAKPVKE